MTGARNGDTTPPEATAPARLEADVRDHAALLREVIHSLDMVREDAGVHLEYAKANHAATQTLTLALDATNTRLDELTLGFLRMQAEQKRQSAKLGIVDSEVKRVDRRASRPDLVAHVAPPHVPDFAGLVYEGEITKVRRERAELAELERVRAESHERRADMWNGAKRVARLALAALIVVAPILWVILKGWIE